jgi:outer membrane receptor protein involved in Fe transport
MASIPIAEASAGAATDTVRLRPLLAATLGDFLFGLPSQLQLANLVVVSNYRQHVHALYVQDDFRVNSKLTLNLGLRWEFATPRWERDNVLSNFDPTTNTMIKA